MSKSGRSTSTNVAPIISYGKENVLNQQYSNINYTNNTNVNKVIYSPNNRNFNYSKSASMFTFKPY